MQTGNLKGFIDRYFLNGCGSEHVLINFNAEETQTHFTGTNQTLIGYVSLNSGIDIGTVGIYQTPLFTKYLGAFDNSDELAIESTKRGEVIQSMELSSDGVNVIITAADPEIIPKPMALKQDMEYGLEIELTPELMDSFRRYKTASNALIVALNVKSDGVEFIFNWSSNNSNRIKYPIKSEFIKSNVGNSTLVCFDANVFSEIFSANKNSSGMISLNMGGLCKIELSDENYECTYYVVKTVV